MALRAGGGPGAAQMVLDVASHGLGLARHDVGQLAGLERGLRQHDRDRRLEGVRQIADMGALSLDHILVMSDQGVQLGGQRFELGGVLALDPLDLALAHIGDFAAQSEQRLQANPDLDDHGGQDAGAHDHQRPGGQRGETPRLAIDRRPVLGRHQDHRRRPAAQLDLHGRGPQRLIQRSHGAVEGLGGRRGLDLRHDLGRRLQIQVEQGARPDDDPDGVIRSGLGDLPIAAGIDPQGAGVGQGRRDDLAVLDADAGVEALDEVDEAQIEPAQRRLLEKGRQRQPRDDQHRQTPAGGQRNQPTDQRTPAQIEELHSVGSPGNAVRR